MKLINIGISLDNGEKGLFNGKMDFSAGTLPLNAAYYRGRQHNITDGAETDDQDFFHFPEAFFWASG